MNQYDVYQTFPKTPTNMAKFQDSFEYNRIQLDFII